MPADFVPTFEPYKHTGKFRFWCQKVLPTVYDDSLSYYELLCKVVKYLNDVIENLDKVEDNLDKLRDAFGDLQDWINTEIDAIKADIEEFKTEVNNAIEAMQEDIDAFKDKMEDDFNDFKTDVNATLATFETRFTQLSQSITNQFNTLRTQLEADLKDYVDDEIEDKIDETTQTIIAVVVPEVMEDVEQSIEEMTTSFEQRIADLEDSVSDIEDTISTLTGDVSDVESDVQTLENRNESIAPNLYNLIPNGYFISLASKFINTAVSASNAEPFGWKAGIFQIGDNNLQYADLRISKTGVNYGLSPAGYTITGFQNFTSSERFVLISEPIITESLTSGPPLYPSKLGFFGYIEYWGTEGCSEWFTIDIDLPSQSLQTQQSVVSGGGLILRIFFTNWVGEENSLSSNTPLSLAISVQPDTNAPMSAYISKIVLYQTNPNIGYNRVKLKNDGLLTNNSISPYYSLVNLNCSKLSYAAGSQNNFDFNKAVNFGTYVIIGLLAYTVHNPDPAKYVPSTFTTEYGYHILEVKKLTQGSGGTGIITIIQEFTWFIFIDNNKITGLKFIRYGRYNLVNNTIIEDTSNVIWGDWVYNTPSDIEIPEIFTDTYLPTADGNYMLRYDSVTDDYSWNAASKIATMNLPNFTNGYLVLHQYSTGTNPYYSWDYTSNNLLALSNPNSNKPRMLVYNSSTNSYSWFEANDLATLTLPGGATNNNYEIAYTSSGWAVQREKALGHSVYYSENTQIQSSGISTFSISFTLPTTSYIPVAVEGYIKATNSTTLDSLGLIKSIALNDSRVKITSLHQTTTGIQFGVEIDSSFWSDMTSSAQASWEIHYRIKCIDTSS